MIFYLNQKLEAIIKNKHATLMQSSKRDHAPLKCKEKFENNKFVSEVNLK